MICMHYTMTTSIAAPRIYVRKANWALGIRV